MLCAGLAGWDRDWDWVVDGGCGGAGGVDEGGGGMTGNANALRLDLHKREGALDAVEGVAWSSGGGSSLPFCFARAVGDIAENACLRAKETARSVRTPSV